MALREAQAGSGQAAQGRNVNATNMWALDIYLWIEEAAEFL